MSTLPPDPYTLKAVETAIKTTITLLHDDVKAGIAELLRIVKERGRERALANANNFEIALEEDFSNRVSIGISPDGYERISGNLGDPDFAYMVSKATIASARTSNVDKHRLLARSVTERLLAVPEGLVALASTSACEIIPNLTPTQLNFLGLACTVLEIRSSSPREWEKKDDTILFQKEYIKWLKNELKAFLPFPKPRPIDFSHLRAMACIDMISVIRRSLANALKPRDFESFTWPENFFETDELILELKVVAGLESCDLTSVGSIIGTHVHDIKLLAKPTEFLWDKQ